MVYAFLDWELSTALFCLRRGAVEVALRPKVYRTLLFLIDQRHRVVSKQELCEKVWPGRIISDATLESTLKELRRLLGDRGNQRRYIQTRAGYGYRFIAEVAQRPDPPPISADEPVRVAGGGARHFPVFDRQWFPATNVRRVLSNDGRRFLRAAGHLPHIDGAPRGVARHDR